jgi:diadenosine tetraphosphatase ApaH/serine/threonine PP2A family protein phosphatase
VRLAVLTDIHGNAEALTAVLADIAARGCDGMAVLGDIVGYGPDPAWCVDRVRSLGCVTLQGNHDAAIRGSGDDMSTNARLAIDWTRGQLSADQADWLAGLPLTAEMEGLALVHASWQAPADWIYVTGEATAAGSFRASRARVTLCGHVHVPQLYSQDLRGMVAGMRVSIGQAMPLLLTRRWLAVVGSVGQPRDRSPLAAWALVDTTAQEITFRRTPYDCGATALKVRAAGLPEALALRLLGGD